MCVLAQFLMKWGKKIAGENGALLFGHFLRGSHVEDIGPGFRFTPRFVFEEHLEHDGFRRRRHRVN